MSETNFDESLRNPPEIGQFKDFLKQSPYTITNANEFSEVAETLLNRYGFKKVGQGLYGVVFINPKYPFALKLYAAYDRDYKNWINYVRTLKGNRYVPRVKGKFPTLSKQVELIAIEPLLPIDDMKTGKFRNNIKSLVAAIKTIRLQGNFDLDGMMAQVDKVYGEGEFDRDTVEIAMYLARHRYLDLHGANVMMRKNGDIVITDPLATED